MLPLTVAGETTSHNMSFSPCSGLTLHVECKVDSKSEAKVLCEKNGFLPPSWELMLTVLLTVTVKWSVRLTGGLVQHQQFMQTSFR